MSLGLLPLECHRTLHQGVVHGSTGGWPLVSAGQDGSWLLSMCSFPHVPSSRPILHVVGSLLSSSSGSGHGISVVFLSASAPLVVSARQAPSAEK